MLNLQAILEEIQAEITPLLGQGKVADYIPALAQIDPLQFSMAITCNDGSYYSVGDDLKNFSIQSISKVYSYTLALRAYKAELFTRVWREPSGNPFNSLVQLEYEAGIPRNPFINAGAIVVSDTLISHFKNAQNSRQEILSFIQKCAKNSDVTINPEVASSEMEHGHRNMSLAHLMKSFGNLENEVEEVIENYFHQCSIAMNVKELSRSMLYLANQGCDPITKERIITPSQAKRINSVMLTCGHYDASGDFAYRVGLPGKSGVGGGIVAIVPQKMAIAVFSPALNEHGNSLVGTKALELFTTKTELSIF
jgi:glutaminase